MECNNINMQLKQQVERSGKVFLDHQVFNKNELFQLKEFIIEDIKKNLLVERHISDIQRIFPRQLMLDKNQLAQIRGISTSSINREKSDARGIPWKEEGGRIMYSVRDIAEWLTQTIKTTN